MRTCVSILLAAFLLPVSCSNTDNPSGQPIAGVGNYVVFAWNDLGMHCLNPTYDKIVLLPPYNNLWVQVVKRAAKPHIVTTGITVSYELENNTFSYGKKDFGQFWDHAVQLFGTLFGFADLPHDVGLKGKGLAGAMELAGDHFVAEGIPITPMYDDGTWDPYQVAVITVKDSLGNVLVKTKATVPTSDEMHCSKCHGADPFQDIMSKHDEEHGTDLAGTAPRLCADCHGDPALGLMGAGSSGIYLSKAMHGFHADKGASCYDCHPGPQTKCSRSKRHAATDGNCIMCHSGMTQVASSIPAQRIPWVNEPKCALCHNNASGVDTGSNLYRNAKGHGQLYCASCHGSPHAMIPSLEAKDNYQALQYQGSKNIVKSIASCGVCHDSSRGGDDMGEFVERHGGSKPATKNGCYICHTSVTTDTAHWPHAYTWKNSN
jgi:hypothetical protein